MSRRLRFWLVSLILLGGLAALVFTAIWLERSGIFEEGGKPHLLMLAVAAGTLVSEDLSTITSGLLAASGRLSYAQACIAAFSGILIGDLIIFWMGYHFGRPLLRQKWSRWLVSERAVHRAQHLFRRKGVWLVLLSRFLPGTRTATYFAAGALHAPLGPFLGAFVFAAGVWTPFLVGLSYLVGRELLELYDLYEALALPVLILAGLLLYLMFHYLLPLATWRGRRRLKGKWIRATRWEYWPWWQVYMPVIPYIFWLGCVRYRRPTLFTAVNPCMPDGGFVGESKSAILAGLASAGEAVPKWAVIEAATGKERSGKLRAAMEHLGLTWPVVLKPDTGQRGAGVLVARGEAAAGHYMDGASGKIILQEYVAGNEYGVFYVRYPEEQQGRITSITIKEQIAVTGNGRDHLERLIHAHPRAIAMLGTFLDRFADRLGEVPPDGEVIRLGELGTHARGSLFLDGRHLLTEDLRERVQAIADTFEGFYFGRFDIKAPSEEAFRKGKGLRVLEVNGVTSEETHMYDPRHGLIAAWRTLRGQWATAFAVAAQNVRRGHTPTPPGSFLKHLLRGRPDDGN